MHDYLGSLPRRLPSDSDGAWLTLLWATIFSIVTVYKKTIRQNDRLKITAELINF